MKTLMKIRGYKFSQQVCLAFAMSQLKAARDAARIADCPKLVRKIKSAIASAGGAQRHMDHRQRRAKT